MLGAFIPLIVLAELGSGPSSPGNLDVAALASPRPAVCRGALERAGPGVWARVRGAEREHYCDLLARAQARLQSAPSEALQAAEAAQQIAGATSAVLVLEGRAALRLGEPEKARSLFVRADADPSAFLELGALRDYARVTSAARDAQRASELYRTLASRASLLEGPLRSAIYLEAAAHVLVAGRGGPDEALAYLGQVSERGAGLGLSDLRLALSALCLDRAESGERARLALSGHPGGLELSASQSEYVPLLPPGELTALNALTAESSDPGRARQLWTTFLEQAAPDNPWLEHARKKRDRLTVPAHKVRP
jgi:hypothetical protein